MASFEDRLTMIIAQEHLRGLHVQLATNGKPEALDTKVFGENVIGLVQGVVLARRREQQTRYGLLLARALDDLQRFRANPRGCIPFIATHANALAALEENTFALVLASDIGSRMAKLTPVSVGKDDVEYVLFMLEEALMQHANKPTNEIKAADGNVG